MTAKKGLIICAIVALLTVILEILFVQHKTYNWWHGFIGFGIVFGFLGGSALILVSKFFGKLVQRKENYYDGGDDSDD